MDVRPNSVEELVEILTRIDPSTPARRDASGRRIYELRCRIPFSFDCPTDGFRFRTTEAPESLNALRARDGVDRAERPIERAAGGGEILDRIEGPASSTSQDWYGTRMTRPCLDSMAEQFKRGIDYLPRHHGWLQSVEWYEVMGRTVDARVERGEVKAAPEGESASDQWILYTTTDLFADCPISEIMVSRIRAGRPPGQSIGGWFTQISVTYDDDGCVIYPVDVLDLELDHLAAVRSPANPDADRVWLAVQRALAAAGEALRSSPPPAPPEPEPTPALVLSTGGPVPEGGTVVLEPPASTISRAMAEEIYARGRALADGYLARSADDFASNDFDEVLRRLSTFGKGASAPAPEPQSRGRDEVPMPLTDEQLAELIGSQIARSLSTALAPLVSRIDALEARGSETDPEPDADPDPVPATETAAERVMRVRAEQAEAELARLQAEPQRRAARSTSTPAPAAAAAPQIPEYARIGPKGDLREIAPQTARIVARAGDELAMDEIPWMVFQRDGLEALNSFAKATGECRAVSALVEREAVLTHDPIDLDDSGKNQHDFGVFRGGIHPTPEQLRSQDDSVLRALLRSVIKAGIRDRLIHASW